MPAATKRWWLAASLTIMALLLFLRNPYAVLNPKFWHEDAFIFLVQQRSLGLAAIFTPYAGYLHLFPRIVAEAASYLPLILTPTVYLTATFAGWLYVGGLILTSPLFAKPSWATVAALAWISVPHGGEVFLVLTNMQWAFAVGFVLLLAEESGTRPGYSHWIFAVISALTGPFCIFLSPLALWRLWEFKRSRRVLDPLALITLLAAIIQLAFIVTSSSRMQQTAGLDPSRLSLLLGIAVFPELFGTKGVFPQDLILRLAGTLVGIAGLAWAIWAAIPDFKTRRLMLLGGALILSCGIASCMSVSGGGAPMAFGGGQRYLFVPFAVFVCALIAALSHHRSGDRTQLLAFALLGAIGYHSSSHFIAPRYPAQNWPQACRYLHEGYAVKMQVCPTFQTVVIPPDQIPHTTKPH